MREAIWGLYGAGGLFFHDDFLVDGIAIKDDEIIFFSRGIPTEGGRLKAYDDLINSPYAHFDLERLAISPNCFTKTIFLKYLIRSNLSLLKDFKSENFSLFQNIYYYYLRYAIDYEKVFSNFQIKAELGHNVFSENHIVESIICRNHRANYYLMQWSDLSVCMDKYELSFLSCDKYFLWGKIFFDGVEGNSSTPIYTGYIFKRFINRVRADKENILKKMGINSKGRIVAFFDESFGSLCKMTGEHYIAFWETALAFALSLKDDTVIIKPKGADRFRSLPDLLLGRFLELRRKIESLENAFIIDAPKWSFIEAIGVADMVITQGMTSSATIAILSNIEGLYLDQAGYNHPFSRQFKGKVVFDNPQDLLGMAQKIINNQDSVFNYIPSALLRQYDEYADDRGLDLMRNCIAN